MPLPAIAVHPCSRVIWPMVVKKVSVWLPAGAGFSGFKLF
jgi:hypothetical protein